MSKIINGLIPLAHIQAHPDNYNKHPVRQVEQLRASLRKFGQVRSIVVQALARGGKYLCVAGHGLVEAARGENIISLRADILPSNWPPHKVKAYLVADNEHARHSEIDEAQLAVLVNDLATVDDSYLQAMAFTASDLAKLNSANGDLADAEPQIDRAAELLKVWKVKRGDLWRIGDHRLLCGDSTVREDVKRVMGGDTCGTLTDPPYGVGFDYAASSWDDAATNDNLTNVVIPDCPKPLVYTCGKRHLLREMQRWTDHNLKLLAWNKKFSMTRSGLGGADTWEIVLVVDPDTKHSTLPTTHMEFMTDREPGLLEGHPCPKPIELFSHLAKHLLTEYVYDPFLGSGTTLVACQNLNRKGRAIEISPAYVSVALQRMADAFPGIEIERVESNDKAKRKG